MPNRSRKLVWVRLQHGKDPAGERTKLLAQLLFDTALLESGFGLNDNKAFNKRVYSLVKDVLKIKKDFDSSADAEVPPPPHPSAPTPAPPPSYTSLGVHTCHLIGSGVVGAANAVFGAASHPLHRSFLLTRSASNTLAWGLRAGAAPNGVQQNSVKQSSSDCLGVCASFPHSTQHRNVTAATGSHWLMCRATGGGIGGCGGGGRGGRCCGGGGGRAQGHHYRGRGARLVTPGWQSATSHVARWGRRGLLHRRRDRYPHCHRQHSARACALSHGQIHLINGRPCKPVRCPQLLGVSLTRAAAR